VLHRIVRLEVLVIDGEDGRPIEGASVEAEFGFEDDRDQTLSSGPSGRTEVIRAPCRRPFLVTVSKPGFVVSRFRFETPCESDETVKTIQLRRAIKATVTVVDGLTEDPIENAVLEAFGVEYAADDYGQVRCDDLPFSQGKPLGVEVRAPGYCSGIIRLSPDRVAAPRGLRIPLYPSCRLVCSVTGAAGEPVTGRRFEVDLDWEAICDSVVSGELPGRVMMPGWPESMRWDPGSTTRTVITDGEGTFRVENLPSGLPRVLVRTGASASTKRTWELRGFDTPGTVVRAELRLDSGM
jgi:hypothetical protein